MEQKTVIGITVAATIVTTLASTWGLLKATGRTIVKKVEPQSGTTK